MRAQSRCTPPMNAPRPPPTMPSRSGGTMSGDAEHAAIRGLVGAGTGEIVERLLGHTNDVVGDELRPLAGAVLRMLDAALPLEHRPAGIVVLRELREDRLEVHLTVAEGTEAAGAIDPRLEPAIHALPAGRIELGILDMKHANAVVIEVDVLEIVELLQHEVTGIVQQVAALVTADALEEHLERHPVVQILARMDLEAGVDAVFVEHVENRAPAPRQLVERRLDQTGRPLRPGIDVGPGESTRERRVLGYAEPARGACRELYLFDRPGGPRRGLAADFGRREGVERGVIRGMDGHQLTLQMRRQLGDLEAALGEDAFYLVTVGLALGGFREVEQAGIPAGDLDALEAEPRGPAGDGLQAVERRRIARELRQENCRPFDRLHRASSPVKARGNYGKSRSFAALRNRTNPSPGPPRWSSVLRPAFFPSFHLTRASEHVILSAAGAKDLLFDTNKQVLTGPRALLKKEIGCHPMVIGLLFLLQLGTPPIYDRVILGGRVMDPASNLDAVRNVGLSDGRIAVITTEPIRGRDTVDARGLVVAPGFIDLHAHGQTAETYRFYALDGVTTALELELGTSDVAAWYREREGGERINYGVSIGHIKVRMAVMHDSGNWMPVGDGAYRAASAAQIGEIANRIEIGLREGAVSIGAGFPYT